MWGELREDGLATLRDMFGERVPEPIGFVSSAWSGDAFSRGSYSYPSVGCGADRFEDLAEPVEDRLWFAGEHVGFAYHGTVHGAYISGRRAARDIARAATVLTIP